MTSNCFKLALLVIFIFAYPACSIAGDDDNAISPLAIDNYWVYEVQAFMGGNPNPIQTMTDTLKVRSSKDWNGYTWYSYSALSADDEGHYYRNDKDGHYQLTISPEYKDGKAELMVKLPLKLNDSWVDEAQSITITVEAVDETVTVPAGRFDGCYRCKMFMSEGAEGTMWVKPGVGQIKMEFKAKQGEMEVRSVRNLTDYNVK